MLFLLSISRWHTNTVWAEARGHVLSSTVCPLVYRCHSTSVQYTLPAHLFGTPIQSGAIRYKSSDAYSTFTMLKMARSSAVSLLLIPIRVHPRHKRTPGFCYKGSSFMELPLRWLQGGDFLSGEVLWAGQSWLMGLALGSPNLPVSSDQIFYLSSTLGYDQINN